MYESAREMAQLSRKIVSGKIAYDDAIACIEQIEKKYGSGAFPPYPLQKRSGPWDEAYLEELERLNMAGVCSKEFFYHLAEVRREIDADRKNIIGRIARFMTRRADCAGLGSFRKLRKS